MARRGERAESGTVYEALTSTNGESPQSFIVPTGVARAAMVSPEKDIGLTQANRGAKAK